MAGHSQPGECIGKTGRKNPCEASLKKYCFLCTAQLGNLEADGHYTRPYNLPIVWAIVVSIQVKHVSSSFPSNGWSIKNTFDVVINRK